MSFQSKQNVDNSESNISLLSINNEHIINVITTPVNNVTINTPITPIKIKRTISEVNNNNENLKSVKKNLVFDSTINKNN
jgi:hypothetical protein